MQHALALGIENPEPREANPRLGKNLPPFHIGELFHTGGTSLFPTLYLNPFWSSCMFVA